MPRWKLENTPPPEEKKQASTEGKKKDDKDKERKSTKSDKGQAQSEKADNKSKDKDKGISSVVLNCTLHIPFSTVIVIIILCLTPAIPAVNPVEVPKEPEFVIFASYSHPPNTPTRHSVLKEMVSRIIMFKYYHSYCESH